MKNPRFLALGLSAAIIALAAAAPSQAATPTCGLDGSTHPSVAYIFGQQTDPGTCSAEVISGCAAVLISPTVAVTSGACADVWANPYPYNVTASWLAFSDQNMIGCGTVSRVASFHAHPDFDYGDLTSPYNIGVVVLAEPAPVTPASLPSAGELDGLLRGDLLDIVSPGFTGPPRDAERQSGSVTFFRADEYFFSARARQSQCVPRAEGGGAFTPGTQDLLGLIMEASWPGNKRVYLRLDSDEARNFLDDFVSLP